MAKNGHIDNLAFCRYTIVHFIPSRYGEDIWRKSAGGRLKKNGVEIPTWMKVAGLVVVGISAAMTVWSSGVLIKVEIAPWQGWLMAIMCLSAAALALSRKVVRSWLQEPVRLPRRRKKHRHHWTDLLEK